MPDPTRETIITLDLAGITCVSDINRADSKEIPITDAETLQATNGVGLVLTNTPVGTEIQARTANNVYRLVHVEQGVVEITGHPQYCPKPVRIPLCGTRWFDQSSKKAMLAPGMSLQFIDRSGRSVLTSRIQSLQVVR